MNEELKKLATEHGLTVLVQQEIAPFKAAAVWAVSLYKDKKVEAITFSGADRAQTEARTAAYIKTIVKAQENGTQASVVIEKDETDDWDD